MEDTINSLRADIKGLEQELQKYQSLNIIKVHAVDNYFVEMVIKTPHVFKGADKVPCTLETVMDEQVFLPESFIEAMKEFNEKQN